MISFKFGIALLLFTFFVWEQRKLGYEVNFYSGLTYHPDDIRNSGVFVIRSSNIKNNRLISADNVFVNPQIVNSKPVHINDIVVVVRNGSRKLIGKHVLIQHELHDTVIGAFMTGIRSSNNFFINATLDSQLFKKEIQKNLGSTINQITVKNFQNMVFGFPSKIEKDKIGKLFRIIDNIISLQQRKLELLSLIKKTIIKHLFKLKNSDSLNLKFKTSCSQWNSKKLGEIAKFINGRAFKQSELLNKGKYPVLRVGNFYTNDKWFYSDLNLNKNKYADKGDLLYTWSATFGPHIWKGPKVIFHYHIWKIDFDPSTVNKTFLFYFLEADKENLLTNSNGSTMIHITKSNMENKIINLPQFSIQQNIGTFLSNLDYLINQEKIKSKQLIQLKRFLLQNMFI
ncbi:restriction endonuclease subunit S [Lactobacillus johnsonii]|uniref:restriction endonuclease subunit S n=1 Tax=Lactobacillus johnsonii TaxID=33959 RepID=UPI002867F50A|nr:restriction endonuclease subunit S [Lactobacillus johnsonii]